MAVGNGGAGAGGGGGGAPPSSSATGQLALSLPRWVGEQYYRHGLFIASNPKLTLTFTVLAVLWATHPLLSVPISTGGVQVARGGQLDAHAREYPFGGGPPIAFLLQIVVKSMVAPYRNDELIRTDAFRGPLASAFKLHLEDLLGFQVNASSEILSMDSECLRTDGLSTRYKLSASVKNLLPEFGCLVLSPANLWQRDPLAFQMDPSIINTVFNFQRSKEGRSSVADLMFGMRQRDTGLTKYPVRNRQRVITYAVTIALKRYNPNFLIKLKEHLTKLYPLHAVNVSSSPAGIEDTEAIHLFFPTRSYVTEVLPFLFTLAALFLYVYFSCNKIELVRCKLLIAIVSVVVVLGAILMALGLSGLTLNMDSKMCVVPYLVAFISLENILVLTRSIVSTPAHLDVKMRVASGLAREGWNITMNLFTEITILTLGFFIGILDNSIQEFCLLAVMGLLSDFFLQSFLFATILSMDMSQQELSDISVRRSSSSYKRKDLFQSPVLGPGRKRTSSDPGGDIKTSVMAPQCSELIQEPEAKRVKFLNFWAKRRIIQRLFIICMIIWISMFVYQTRLLETVFKATHPVPHEHFLDEEHFNNSEHSHNHSESLASESAFNTRLKNISALIDPTPETLLAKEQQQPASYKKLLHPSIYQGWKRLPYTHWPMLFGLYNMSLIGRHITLVPPVQISLTISPESAKQLRHPQEEQRIRDEMQSSIHSVESLKTVLELTDEDFEESSPEDDADTGGLLFGSELNPFVPTSPGEIFLAFVFAFPSIAFLLYLVVVFYRCICSRNYAEWRTSWDGTSQGTTSRDLYTQVVQESVPIPLSGHRHEIEAIVADGAANLLVSLCLEGLINAWDSYTGEKVTTIDRARYFSSHCEFESTVFGHQVLQSQLSMPSSSNSIPPRPKVNTNFLCKRGTPETLTMLASSTSTNVPYREDVKGETAIPSPTSSGPAASPPPRVWCMDANDRYIVLGCDNGRIEVWGARDATFKCCSESATGVGVTHVKMIRSKVAVARLAGYIEFYELVSGETGNNPANSGMTSVPCAMASANSIHSLEGTRRFHVRSSSTSSPNLANGAPGTSPSGLASSWTNSGLALNWLQAVKAHQQPITCFETGGGFLLTGSQDHTVRLFRLSDHSHQYNLHGHCGPITTAFIDPSPLHSTTSSGTSGGPLVAGSGSQDGMVCLWDLLSGACVYSILAHDGEVTCLTASPSYVLSMGTDAKLCVLERFQGHLINTIHLSGSSLSRDLIMLTHNLLVTSREGHLVVWDARLPDPVKLVRLGADEAGMLSNVTMLRHLGDTIACNYGSQLRLVHFPLLSDKKD